MLKGQGRWAATAIVLACVGACAGPVYFDLQSEVPPNPGSTKIDKVLLIDRIETNTTYRDYRIVIREAPFRVKYASFASWSKPPEELIEDAVIRFFRSRSVFRKVITSASPDESDLTLTVRIEAIEKIRVGKDMAARLALDVDMTDSRSEAVLWSHSFDRKMALEGKKTRRVPEKISLILREELMKIEAVIRDTEARSGRNRPVQSRQR